MLKWMWTDAAGTHREVPHIQISSGCVCVCVCVCVCGDISVSRPAGILIAAIIETYRGIPADNAADAI